MNALNLINFGSSLLKQKNILSHKLDSEILLSEVLQKKREEVLINLNQKISKKKINKYKKLIKRRAKSEPIAYILKNKEFWSKNFFVNKNTLIPRPETELIVERLIAITKKKGISILDVGTGSGCILISLISELKCSKGIGIDISNKALNVARKNRDRHGMQKKLLFLKKSITSEFHQKFDLVVSNPPYIKTKEFKNLSTDIQKYEPKIALDGGNDGLDLIKKVIYKTKNILKLNGMLALEIGNEQIDKVSKILLKNNFKVEHIIRDYKENVRGVISTYIKYEQ